MKSIAGMTTIIAFLISTSTVVGQTSSTPADEAQSASKAAEIAKDAYEKSDAGPTENWFGCPPKSKSDNNDTPVEGRTENCEAEQPDQNSVDNTAKQ